MPAFPPCRRRRDGASPRDGDDCLTGGGWADHYVFDRQDGTDTITDFTPWGSPRECEGSEFCIAIAVSLDRIVLKGGSQSDIKAAVAGVTADGQGDAVVHYGETDIVLAGIQSDAAITAQVQRFRHIPAQ
jgi:hypothetical protein